MAGKKDCVTLKGENGDKTVISKRLILCNLKEAYKMFKDRFSEIKVGFSKFSELRPKHCILAGRSGTHSVCVCTTHQNIKLMMENAKLGMLTNGELASYKHCLAKVLCNPASIQCNMGNCSSCPGMDQTKNILENAFDDNMVDKITFRQWVTVDRCNLETMQKTSSEFIEIFCEKLTTLIRHDFIAKQQSCFINEVKEDLKEGEFVVTCDFSENYTFVIQDEAQSYHWSNDHATVHPFVIYFKEEKKTQHISYVIISNCLEHNTTAVYCFQKKLIEFLKNKFQTHIQKIYYFSDGSAAQYKNKKNFINLCFHKKDFGIETEWHFFASAHGKGPCDGVGGTVKRLATKASLQRPYDNQILTPEQLFDWAVKNIKSVHFEFSTQEEYIETETFLEERFSQSVTIKGTQKLHAFIPIASSTSKILVKTFSNTTECSVETVTKSLEKLSLGDIHGYITVIYDNKWWLAYVLSKDEGVDEVKVTFLHPAGPSLSYTYPRKPDILWISVNDVVCKVNPVTPTGRIYQIPENDVVKTNEAFKKLVLK